MISSRFRRQTRICLVRKIWRAIKCHCGKGSNAERNQVCPAIIHTSFTVNDIE